MPRPRAASNLAQGPDGLADRIRAALPAAGRSEQRMFGGVGFMMNGNMAMGTFRGELLVRVGKERDAEALRRAGARPMEMRGRPMAGYVMVDPARLDDAALKDWARLALEHARGLPAKPSGPKPKRKSVPQKKGARAQ